MFVGVVSEFHLAVLIGTMILIFRAFTLSRDLRALQVEVDRALPVIAARDSRERLGSLSKMWTREGQKVAQFFEMLIRRFREIRVELTAERESEAFSAVDVTAHCEEINASELAAVVEVIEALRDRITARNFAVGWEEGSNGVVIVDSGSIGAVAEAIRKELRAILADQHGQGLFGLRQLANSSGLAAGLGVFGLKFSVAFPLWIKGHRGLLWAGYSTDIEPPQRDLKFLSNMASGFEAAVQTRFKLLSLDKSLRNSEEVNRARDNFIAGVSHDIKTPLHNLRNIILLLSAELKNAGFDNAKPSENLELIPLALKNCDLAQEMIEDLMYFSRYQLGRLVASPVRLDISTELTEIVSAFQGSAQLKGVKLDLQLNSSPVFGHWDRKHFRRVISNLVSNSIKYTDSGAVVVRLNCSSAGIVELEVSDSGSGISTESLPHLFEPYRRFSEMGDGVGLGLTIVKILSEINSAKIFVSSKLNQGSSFRIEFLATEGLVRDSKLNLGGEAMQKAVG